MAELSPSFGKREWIVLGCLLVMAFMLGAGGSLQAPLYPVEALKKGVKASVYGTILGIFYLVPVIGAPILSTCLIKGKTGWWDLGLRQCFVFQWFISGTCVVAYGFSDFIDSTTVFIGYSFLLRIVQGIGSVSSLVKYITVCLVFPRRIAMVAALTESAFYGSEIAGPVLGEILFAVGGYPTPWLVFGLITLGLACVATASLPELPKVTATEISTLEGVRALWKVLQTPRSMLFFYASFISNFGSGFITTTLAEYLEQFKLSNLETGVVFALLYLPMFTAPLFGFLSDRTTWGEFMGLVGSLIGLAGITLIGPLSFLPIKPTVVLTAIGLLLYGTGLGALRGSNFYNLVRDSGNTDTGGAEVGSAVVVGASCFYYIATSLGSFLGPILSGVLFDIFGFRESLILVWISYVGLAFTLLLFIICKNKTQISTHDTAVLQEPSENYSECEPLLS